MGGRCKLDHIDYFVVGGLAGYKLINTLILTSGRMAAATHLSFRLLPVLVAESPTAPWDCDRPSATDGIRVKSQRELSGPSYMNQLKLILGHLVFHLG